MEYLALLLIVTTIILTGCDNTSLSTPYPTYTPTPFGEAFLKDLQARIKNNDTIPATGRNSIIALIGGEPTYVLGDNKGIVLQFIAALPQDKTEIKKAAVLLIRTGVVLAGEHNISLSGIEVVFLTSEGDPWLATALIPPWDVANDLRLKSLNPNYIKQLQEAGWITPAPVPTY